MPTSLAEWTCFLVVSLVVGIAVGGFAQCLSTIVAAIVALQFVAAPLIYWLPPFLEHGPMAEYQAWALIGVPMIAIQSSILSFAVAFLMSRRRRAAYKQRQASNQTLQPTAGREENYKGEIGK
jgi:uncharacterized membrane protein required for colicin V production